MTTERLRFDRFVLDCRNRQLRRDGVPVELNARYLDALILLVRERGRLVSKDRFMQEVWQGVPVHKVEEWRNGKALVPTEWLEVPG